MKNITSRKFAFLMQSQFNSLGYLAKISILIYFVIGFAFLTEGLRTIFDNPYICLPVQVNYTGDYVLYLIGIFQGLLHLFVDLSITMTFVGIIAIWGALNYSKSRSVDLSLISYFSVSACIHVNESLNEDRVVHSPLYSLIPLILIIVVINLKRKENDNS